jgi:hypothetical protein
LALLLPTQQKRPWQTRIAAAYPAARVEAGAAIFSDELDSCTGLADEFKHEVINHAVAYVEGNVHTNTMENFWSPLKRGLQGTYISVEPFPLVPLLG